MSTTRISEVDKVATGIPGFEVISEGGLPRSRTTLIAGTAGSAKTVFSAQFLAEGIQKFGETGVFVTFEDTPDDIRANMMGFGWDIQKWEDEGSWVFVDAAPRPSEITEVVGPFDLSALVARIRHAAKKAGAQRIAMDSLNALFHQFEDEGQLRAELFRVSAALKEVEATTVMTAERTNDYGPVTRVGIEEFVTDNVIILRHALDDEKRRRTIEILKFRGTPHENGEFPFTVAGKGGITVIPLSGQTLTQQSTDVRISSGNRELDRMCGGGFFRDSVILVSGATGTGKTLMTTEFLGKGAEEGERSLLFAFEESREQLYRNAKGWGTDFKGMEAGEKLKIDVRYPHASTIEYHLLRMRTLIEEFKPTRVAIDSLSALERVASLRTFREFVINLTSFIKQKQIAGLFTSTTPSLSGGGSVTERHISTLTDTILMLRYVESAGRMRRGLTVLKMRGSPHDRDIREYHITKHGMEIGEPFTQLTGILGRGPMFPEGFMNQFAAPGEGPTGPSGDGRGGARESSRPGRESARGSGH